MSQNIQQIFTANPASSMVSTDLLYLGRSPYGPTDDFAITFANFVASIGTATPAASTISRWDANLNFSANNFLPSFATTVTATAITTLDVGSAYWQLFTGTSSQTVMMPVTSTLAVGQSWMIVNDSSGAVTVESSGSNSIQVMAANTSLLITCISLSGTTAASWQIVSYSTSANVYPLSLALGGTNNALTASAGGIVWSDDSKLNIVAGTSTAGQLLLSGNAATPVWSTSTYPATNAINTLLYASSANTMAALATANSSVLITSSGGVPSWSATLPSGIDATDMNLTTPTLGVASATSVNFGGSALSVYGESTSYSPTITFDTPGDLSVSYATQVGTYTQIGNIVSAHFTLSCTPTFTTASGNLRVVLPVTPSSNGAGALQFQSSTWPVGGTSIFLQVVNGNTGMVVGVNGSAIATAYLTTTQCTSGSNLNIVGSVTYLV